MLRKLTVDQINDWFTIGKTVTDVELLGSPPAFPAAEAARDEARCGAGAPGASPATSAPAQAQGPARQAASGRPVSQRPAELEYIDRYKQLEAQELDARGVDLPGSRPGSRPMPARVSNAMCIPETTYRYPDLPINRCKEEVVSLIESNSVVIIHGATGSGKSTQLPQYVLDRCVQRATYCHIAVTQPRKIGASSVARWISRERAWALGGLVGYQVGLERVATEDTRLVYMTTGVLLQKVVRAKSLTEFTHIFVDEVHERTEEMDFLLLVIRKLLRTNSCFVKVILMSATINCKEFADYFAVPVQNQLIPACVFEVPGRPHAIEERYLDDLTHVPHGRLSPHVLEEPVITKDMYEVAVSLIQTFDDVDVRESGSRTGPAAQVAWERSSVLVFLPGERPREAVLTGDVTKPDTEHVANAFRLLSTAGLVLTGDAFQLHERPSVGLSEINCMHELLTNMTQKRLQVYPLHSSVTLEEQSNVFLSPVPGYRKVILSTNIAESSVTVPDVKYVIDFCLTRTLVCDEDTNYQSLRLSWASKTSCNQRKGRAGRVSRGYCYRLVHRDFWDSAIPDHVVPEMLRCPLGSTVLKVKLLDMGEPRALLATALSPPRLGDIGRTVLLLKEVGALAVSGQREDENPHDGELTFLGRVLAQLPVSQQLGKLIVLGHVFGCLDECLIIAAALSLKSFFTMPFRQHLDGYRNKVFFSGNSKSDCIALVEAFRDELDWGRLNYIQIKRIREVAELYEELKSRVSQFNMHVGSRQPALDQEFTYKQRFILQVVLAGAFYPNYFTFGQPDEEMAVRELAGKDPKTTIVLKRAPPYGFLYHKQLQSLFRQCGQVKSVTFDGAKAFVEFSRNPTERFKTLPAVYLAVKMSQLKVPLELSVHSAEEIEGRLLGGAASRLRNTRVSVDFQKQTVDPVRVPFSAPDRPRLVSDLLLTVDVTEVVEVGHFWGYRMDQRNAAVLKKLSAEIDRLQLVPLAVHPHPDLVCLAPYADAADEPHYFRAQILYVSGGSAEVFFVDYGNKSRVGLGLLMEIPCHLLELPFQALEFRVCRLRPSARSLVCGEHWSGRAGQRFAALVGGRALLVEVFSVVHGVLHVDAYLSSGPRDMANVRDVLIEEGHAELAEECYESRQSHDVLTSLFSKAAEHGTDAYAPSPESDKEKQLIRVLLDSFSSNKLGTPSHKAVLRGPFNPYELKCHSLTRVSKFRRVWIEKESINSVAFSDTPGDLHQRVLVAASLSVNATGSTMLLRETSLLPHVPGLPALLSMLFAPVMELRVDRAGKCYTGVLCGLGWHPGTGAPVLPEHDMELAFDVQFSVEDIVEINILRATINKLACDGPNGSRCLGPDRVTQLQDRARQKLLGLFCQSKPRERTVPRWHERPYEWDQVDPELVVEPAERAGGRGKSTALYQLHRPVLLSP